MASLLDMMMQQVNPNIGGLLASKREQPSGAPQMAPAAPAGGAPQGEAGPAMDPALVQAMQSASSPMSPEQDAAVRRQGMLYAGLTMLATGNTAQGALVGLEAAGRAKERAQQAMAAAAVAEQRRAVGAVITKPEGLSREDVDRAIALATAQGDLENVDRLIKLKDTFPQPSEAKPFQVTDLPDGTKGVFDPNTGTFLAPNGDPILDMSDMVQGPEDSLQIVQGVDSATGQPAVAVVNLNRGTAQIVDGIRPEQKSESTTIKPEMFETAASAVNARRNFGIIEAYLDKRIADNPDHPLKGFRFERERYLQTGVLSVHAAQRQRLDAETQEFLQAMDGFLLEEANRIAGVRGVSSTEARAAVWRTFGFEEGDLAGNIINTREELRTKVIGLEGAAGPALWQIREAADDERRAAQERLNARMQQPAEPGARFSNFGRRQ